MKNTNFIRIFTEEKMAKIFAGQAGGEIIVRYDYDEMRGKIVKQFEVRY